MSKSSEIVLDLIRLIAKPSFKRESPEIQLVLPWLKKRSQLLQHQENSVLVDIVKHCTFLETHHNDVIIKQGDRGDSYFEEFCFYVLLRGSVSVYIDPKITGESADDLASKRGSAKKKTKKEPEKPKPAESEFSSLSVSTKTGSEGEPKPESEMESNEDAEAKEEERRGRKQPEKLVSVDRNKFGKFIVTYGVGDTFGEIALVHKDSFRNATIVSDDDADLMVIDQELFDRSLRAEQEARYQEIRDFIDLHPFFCHMTPKFKKLLEMSLRKEKYIFDTNIVRQGDPVIGLHFIISGGAQITVEPKKHKHQYIDLWPFEAGVDTLSIEFEHLRELRKTAILRKYEDPAVWETMPEDIMIRRNEGYAAIEKHMQEKKISLCTVQAKEVLGDMEILLGLSTYMQTVRCTANTECFILDTKNFERLIGKKNNVQTTDVMRAYVIDKLSTRMNMRHADLIPLLGYLHQKLTEQTLPPQKGVEAFKTSKSLPDVNEEMQHLLQYFREGRDVVLIKPGVPGLVYYKELMHQKAQNRALQRKTSKAGENIKLGSVYKTRQKRKPRSMLQIRESLRVMMENELIEMENKKLQKKLKAKQITEPNAGRTSQTGTMSRTSGPQDMVVTKLPDEDRAIRNTKPSLTYIDNGTPRKRKNGIVSPTTSDACKENDTTEQKPVLVTELAREINDNLQGLPAIREEKTQEEIILNAAGKVISARSDKGVSGTLKNIAKERSSDTSLRDEIPTKIEKSSGLNINLDPDGQYAAHIITPKTPQHKTPTKQSTSPKATSVSPKPKSVTPKSTSISSTPNSISPKPKSISPKRKSISPMLNSSTPSELKANVPQLPAINVVQVTDEDINIENGPASRKTSMTENWVTEEREPTDEQKKDLWQTPMNFVKERIQNRLLNSNLNKSDPRDYETSEGAMKLLENRIRAFHVKYGEGHKTKNLPHLRRYKLDALENKAVERPKPGGKVWIKKRLCKFANSEYLVKDHKHVHYHMVDNIPQFNEVKKTKAVMQRILDGRKYQDDTDFFEDTQQKPIAIEDS